MGASILLQYVSTIFNTLKKQMLTERLAFNVDSKVSSSFKVYLQPTERLWAENT